MEGARFPCEVREREPSRAGPERRGTTVRGLPGKTFFDQSTAEGAAEVVDRPSIRPPITITLAAKTGHGIVTKLFRLVLA